MKRFLEGRTIVAVVGTILVCGAATAGAAKLINGSDVKNGSLTGKDVKNASLTAKDVKQGTLTSGDVKNSTLQGADIKDASIAGADLSAGAKASVFSGPNWGIADRNVLGNGDSYLRAGPVVVGFEDIPAAEPPYGIGSLGLRTGSPEDKATFGNQVDFIGMPLADIDELSYWVYTTAENIAVDPGNLPAVQFEIDANLEPPPSIDFTTASIIPPAQLPGWHETDVVADGDWFLTGDEGTATGCNQTTTCTLAELQDAVPDAVIFTVLINKGTDHAFSGAVDGLQINSDVYDFEPHGVLMTTAP